MDGVLLLELVILCVVLIIAIALPAKGGDALTYISLDQLLAYSSVLIGLATLVILLERRK